MATHDAAGDGIEQQHVRPAAMDREAAGRNRLPRGCEDLLFGDQIAADGSVQHPVGCFLRQGRVRAESPGKDATKSNSRVIQGASRC